VFVPPGTYNENLSITTDGLTLLGTGNNSEINGGSSIAIRVSSDNVIIKNLAVTTDVSNGSNGIKITSSNCVVDNCFVHDAGGSGIEDNGSDQIIVNNRVTNVEGFTCIDTDLRAIVAYNNVDNPGGQGMSIAADDSIAANNIVRNTPNNNGIAGGSANNLIYIGNRIMNTGVNGIAINGNDCIVANNRISDTGGQDISDNGVNTLLDGNLTGPSN
jgi:hypothetical protein